MIKMEVLPVNAKLDFLNLKNTCRLCSGKMDLVWVFDKKFDFPQTMRDIIAATTTVEILTEDPVSQKICTKCVAVAIKMFQFRDQAIRNDKYLKEQYEQLTKTHKLKTPSTSKTDNIKNENTAEIPVDTKDKKDKIHIQEKKYKEDTDEKKPKVEKAEKNPEIKHQVAKPQPAKPTYRVHPSITSLFKVYPKIRLPTVCLKSNISPSVLMKMDAVENYFKARKLNFQKCSQLALKKPNRVAMKSTSAAAKRGKKLTIPHFFASLRNFRKQNKTDKTTGEKPIEIDLTGPDTPEVPSRRRSLTKNSEKCAQDDSSAGPSRLSRSSGSPNPTTNVVPTRRNKRQLSSDSSSSQRSVKRPLIIETTESITPSSASPVLSSFSDDVPDLSFSRSHELHVCNICSSVHLHATQLKRHQLKHLRCQFCKAKFKTLEIKDKHVESQCKIQKVMKSMTVLPDIPLQKIETHVKIRRKFHKAFSAYNLVPDSELKLREKVKSGKRFKGIANIETNTSDIIEILSDEEETKSKNDSSTASLTNIPLNPHVKVIDSSLNPLLLDNVTDIKVIKSLLLQYNKLHRKVNDATQTFLPTNELIKINHGELTIEMKSLKQHLFYYKIPIDVKNGPTINICYKYDSRFREVKELHPWDDIVPVDVKFSKTENKQNENVQNDCDDAALSKKIKEETLDAYGEEHAGVEEILVEEIYNQSIPVLQTVRENLHIIEDSVNDVDDLRFSQDMDPLAEHEHYNTDTEDTDLQPVDMELEVIDMCAKSTSVAFVESDQNETADAVENANTNASSETSETGNSEVDSLEDLSQDGENSVKTSEAPFKDNPKEEVSKEDNEENSNSNLSISSNDSNTKLSEEEISNFTPYSPVPNFDDTAKEISVPTEELSIDETSNKKINTQEDQVSFNNNDSNTKILDESEHLVEDCLDDTLKDKSLSLEDLAVDKTVNNKKFTDQKDQDSSSANDDEQSEHFAADSVDNIFNETLKDKLLLQEEADTENKKLNSNEDQNSSNDNDSNTKISDESEQLVRVDKTVNNKKCTDQKDQDSSSANDDEQSEHFAADSVENNFNETLKDKLLLQEEADTENKKLNSNDDQNSSNDNDSNTKISDESEQLVRVDKTVNNKKCTDQKDQDSSSANDDEQSEHFASDSVDNNETLKDKLLLQEEAETENKKLNSNEDQNSSNDNDSNTKISDESEQLERDCLDDTLKDKSPSLEDLSVDETINNKKLNDQKDLDSSSTNDDEESKNGAAASLDNNFEDALQDKLQEEDEAENKTLNCKEDQNSSNNNDSNSKSSHESEKQPASNRSDPNIDDSSVSMEALQVSEIIEDEESQDDILTQKENISTEADVSPILNHSSLKTCDNSNPNAFTNLLETPKHLKTSTGYASSDKDSLHCSQDNTTSDVPDRECFRSNSPVSTDSCTVTPTLRVKTVFELNK